jgi:hypothetical protein
MPDDETPPEGGKQFTPIATQEDLDRIIGQRLAREQAKYANYDDLKVKAEKFDQAQVAAQTAEQRIEAEKTAIATERDTLASKVAALSAAITHRLTPEDAAALEGVPADRVEALAERLAANAVKTTTPPPTRRPPKSGVTTGDDSSGKERAAQALRGYSTTSR